MQGPCSLPAPLGECLHTTHHPPTIQVNEIVAEVDHDGTGELEYQEYLEVRIQLLGRGPRESWTC
jgi:hypothetical protein